MGLLTKISMIFMCATLAYGDELFIEPCQEAQMPCCLPMDPGYNFPARIETFCTWDIYTDFSFNYWQPTQENMELGQLDKGTTQHIATAGGITTSVTTSGSFQAIDMDFDFKPGFTIGMGYKFAHDEWDLRVEYTWFHNTNTHSATATNFVLFDANAENISPTWGTSVQAGADADYQFANERWKLDMDLIDLDFGRWYYVGRKLTFHPSFGARAALIQQKVHISYTNGFAPFLVAVPGIISEGFFVGNTDVYNTSHSWAVGPKVALETNWMFGCGFRLYGNGEADILYTRYSSLKDETASVGNVVGLNIIVPFSFSLSNDITGAQTDADYLRTHLSLEMGFGWGTHLYRSKYYIDCSAGYEFQVFFDQNMFRHDVTDAGSFIPNGNLYTNGLITKVRFDF